MQTNHKYQNLFRSLELAKQTKQPYVPYDKEELRMLPVHIAVNHLPIDEGQYEGWECYYPNTTIKELTGNIPGELPYETFLTNLGLLVEDPSKITVGVTAMQNGKGFMIYKRNNP